MAAADCGANGFAAGAAACGANGLAAGAAAPAGAYAAVQGNRQRGKGGTTRWSGSQHAQVQKGEQASKHGRTIVRRSSSGGCKRVGSSRRCSRREGVRLGCRACCKGICSGCGGSRRKRVSCRRGRCKGLRCGGYSCSCTYAYTHGHINQARQEACSNGCACVQVRAHAAVSTYLQQAGRRGQACLAPPSSLPSAAPQMTCWQMVPWL